MAKNTLDRLLRSGRKTQAWEQFHEASKTSEFEPLPSTEVVRNRMVSMWPSFPFEDYPTIPLPAPDHLGMTVTEAIINRETGHDIGPTNLTLAEVGTLLFHASGETRDKTKLGYPRRFRSAPSGGGMYPLEIYLHSTRIVGAQPGIYHYFPPTHSLQRLVDGDLTSQFATGLVQSRLASDSALLIFITSVSERSTFKYGERGYRFALLEAGHVAQNLAIAATAQKLAVVTVGGYFDHVIDSILGMDGLDQSTIYVVALGAHSGDNWLV